MSNVLIGIIGVILFIGLALAGALFLGPRFQESTATARGAAMVQGATQVARAHQMYAVSTGQTSQNSTDLVGLGYLKSFPANPTNAAFVYTALGQNGSAANGSNPPVMVVGGIDGGAQVSKSTCIAIARSAGQTLDANGDVPVVTNLNSVTTDTGCLNMGAVQGDLIVYRYVFAKI